MVRSLCKRFVIGLAFMGLAVCAAAADDSEPHHHGAALSDCKGPGLDCASVATPLLAADGTLWLVWGANGQVTVARSSDFGHSFLPGVQITPQPGQLDAGGDGRPLLVRDGKGRLTVAFAVFKDAHWNAQVLVSTSRDGGHSFSNPHPITDNPFSQRFASLASDGRNGIFAAWIDKRTVAAARTHGLDKPGAALAFAWSRDGGQTFSPSRIFKDGSCECCRLGVVLDRRSRPAVLSRALFEGGVRDHALVVFRSRTEPGAATRLSQDNWAINGCPHHGPSLAISDAGTYHASWYTLGPVRQGVFYARSTDEGRTFSPPLALGAADRHPTRPYVLAVNGTVWLAWKEFDGEATSIWVMRSADDGMTWSAARQVAQTTGSSDHPLLVGDGKKVFLSWLSRPEGYRLIPLEAAP